MILPSAFIIRFRPLSPGEPPTRKDLIMRWDFYPKQLTCNEYDGVVVTFQICMCKVQFLAGSLAVMGAWTWMWKPYDPSKHQELFTQWQSTTTQNTSVFTPRINPKKLTYKIWLANKYLVDTVVIKTFYINQTVCFCSHLLFFSIHCFTILIIIIIIIIFIHCNWVVTRWQWLFYMYTKHEIGYYWI